MKSKCQAEKLTVLKETEKNEAGQTLVSQKPASHSLHTGQRGKALKCGCSEPQRCGRWKKMFLKELQ